MAHKSSNQYFKDMVNASNKMQTIADSCNNLTAEQHDALATICRVRHEFHCNMDHIAKSDEQRFKKKLIAANIDLKNSGLTPMSFIPVDTEDYIDIDTIDERYEYEDVPEDDNERLAWYNNAYEEIYTELSALHGNIEDYLRYVDSEFGTSYAPSGAMRNI